MSRRRPLGAVLAVLCLVVLPVWLLARKAPEMIVHVPAEAEPATR